MGSHDTRRKHRQICFPLPHFTSSPDNTEHGIPLRKDRLITTSQHHNLQLGCAMSPAGVQSFPPLPNARSLLQRHQRDKPKGSHHRSEPEPRRAGAATHRLWAGSWPCSVAPAASSPALSLPLLFPNLISLPASPSSAQEPHPLFLRPSSEELPTTQAPLAKHQGRVYVPKAALEITCRRQGQSSS